KAGIYSEAGDNTCGSIWDADAYGVGVGFFGHEEQDARTFFDEWGYDYIKVDFCGADRQKLDEKAQYTRIWRAIQSTAKAKAGGEVRLNICRWAFPGTWVAEVGGSWRISADIRNSFSGEQSGLPGVRDIFEQNLYLAAYASPGRFNDMDMMQVGRGMTEDEEKSHFGLWCIMSSPLMVGCDLRTIPQSTLDIITNSEVIAVNQDTLGLQAQVVSRSGHRIVVAKPVEVRRGATRAVALFNGEDAPQLLRITFKDVQLGGKVKVRDLWTKTDIGLFNGYYEALVPAHGTAMLRLEGQSTFDKLCYEGEYAFMNAYTAINSSYSGARVEAASDAVASGGYRMSRLGGSPENWAEFRDVYVSQGGKYALKLYYYSPESRSLSVIVNGAERRMANLNSGGVSKRAEASIEVELRQGSNVIRLANPTGRAPDVDMFEIKPL
ncbi:MAG: alpha-galactosidase, partial [Prevotellaceae bacterium]|nr:alpha-galactosidase [Prevotellaceae bacterium]